MAKTNARRLARIRRKRHIRKRVVGTAARPRLSIFRSAKHIYAQLVDDASGHTLASASSLALGGECAGGNREGARLVGARLAELAAAANVTSVVFDRGGYLYHGRLAALADAAREAGLEF
jgi:large subunit ribosomal protein L18